MASLRRLSIPIDWAKVYAEKRDQQFIKIMELTKSVTLQPDFLDLSAVGFF